MHALNSAEAIETQQTKETLVVFLVSDNSDGGKRATLAFTAATCAAAMDKRVIIFMVGDGAHWAYEGRTAHVQQHGFPPLGELLDCLIEMGGEMYVCPTCDEVCSVPSDEEADNFRRHQTIQPRGMSAILSDMTDGRSATF